jgi:hypothetical protein
MGASDAGHAKGSGAAAALHAWLPKPTAMSTIAANVVVEGTKLIAFFIGLPPGVDALLGTNWRKVPGRPRRDPAPAWLAEKIDKPEKPATSC